MRHGVNSRVNTRSHNTHAALEQGRWMREMAADRGIDIEAELREASYAGTVWLDSIGCDHAMLAHIMRCEKRAKARVASK